MRRPAIAAAVLGLSLSPLVAQDAGPGRYAVEPSVDGFIRLDTGTGAISHCNRRDRVWRCDVIAADRGAIEELTAEVRALGARLDRLVARVDDLDARGQAALQPPAAAGPAEPGLAEVLVDRLYRLVHDIKRQQQSG